MRKVSGSRQSPKIPFAVSRSHRSFPFSAIRIDICAPRRCLSEGVMIEKAWKRSASAGIPDSRSATCSSPAVAPSPPREKVAATPASSRETHNRGIAQLPSFRAGHRMKLRAHLGTVFVSSWPHQPAKRGKSRACAWRLVHEASAQRIPGRHSNIYSCTTPRSPAPSREVSKANCRLRAPDRNRRRSRLRDRLCVIRAISNACPVA